MLKRIKRWTDLCNNVWIWTYVNCFKYELFNFPDLFYYREKLKLYADLGIKGIFCEAEHYESEHTEFMREIDNAPKYDEMISSCLDTILNVFVKPEEKALFETVGANGERLNSPDGRFINPGHAMETAWFMMKEAIHRKDRDIMERCMEILRWSLERGWDEEKGGIFYFVDVENKPVLSLEWDMKLLWVHCEAMIALAYSYWYTKDTWYMEWFDKIMDYVWAHYPDEGHPEWFGHLHRDGTPINYIKGSDWKGPFHNVRAFMVLTQIFKALANGEELDF